MVSAESSALRNGELEGFIDPHVHAAPEHIPRLLDDLSVVRQALEAKMGGVIIKSHTTLTAERAFIASTAVPGMLVRGGLVLNNLTGGFNPAAVEAALHYGAAEIWMPTIDAANHRRFHHEPPSKLEILDGSDLRPLHEILGMIAQHDVILGTGHLSAQETFRLVRLAREHGVKKILVTHPEAPFIDMDLSMQSDLARLGCLFERTWVFTTPVMKRVLSPEKIIEDIKAVGHETTVLASDMGQVGNPPPVEGFREFVNACLGAGFRDDEVFRMGSRNIANWLK